MSLSPSRCTSTDDETATTGVATTGKNSCRRDRVAFCEARPSCHRHQANVFALTFHRCATSEGEAPSSISDDSLAQNSRPLRNCLTHASFALRHPLAQASIPVRLRCWSSSGSKQKVFVVLLRICFIDRGRFGFVGYCGRTWSFTKRGNPRGCRRWSIRHDERREHASIGHERCWGQRSVRAQPRYRLMSLRCNPRAPMGNSPPPVYSEPVEPTGVPEVTVETSGEFCTSRGSIGPLGPRKACQVSGLFSRIATCKVASSLRDSGYPKGHEQISMRPPQRSVTRAW
jgi:hypothetical protein